jgi:hypothetical protein
MEKVRSIFHRGKNIILLDLSNCKPEESIGILPAARETIARCAPKSALVLTDVTGASYNQAIANEIKNFVRDNTPYIKASAVVGAVGVSLVLLNTVIFLTHRDLKTFKTRQEAQDWLASVV